MGAFSGPYYIIRIEGKVLKWMKSVHNPQKCSYLYNIDEYNFVLMWLRMSDFAPIALILESASREWNPKHTVDLTNKLMHSCHSRTRDLRTTLVRSNWSIHYFHIDHNATCLSPRILHNNCFQFLLGITVVPREIENNGYAKFFGGEGGWGRGGKQDALWPMWRWWIAYEYSLLSSLLATRDVSPRGTSAPQRQKIHIDDVKSVRNLVRSSDWST